MWTTWEQARPVLSDMKDSIKRISVLEINKLRKRWPKGSLEELLLRLSYRIREANFWNYLKPEAVPARQGSFSVKWLAPPTEHCSSEMPYSELGQDTSGLFSAGIHSSKTWTPLLGSSTIYWVKLIWFCIPSNPSS